MYFHPSGPPRTLLWWSAEDARDQDIEAAEGVDGEADGGGDGRLLHDRRVDEGGLAAGSGHVGDGLLAAGVVDVGDDHRGAFRGERIDARASDA